MCKRGRAEDKGMIGDKLVGYLKGVRITPSLFVGFLVGSWCIPLSPYPWSPRAQLVFSVPSLPKPSWTALSVWAASLASLGTSSGVRIALVDFDERFYLIV